VFSQALKAHQFSSNIKNNNSNISHINMNHMKPKSKNIHENYYDTQSGENNENHNDENYLQQINNGEISMEVDKKYMSFSAEQVQCEIFQMKLCAFYNFCYLFLKVFVKL
jgi:hypothetical protein